MSIYDLYKIPYNNARCIYDASEMYSPDELGGDCIYIAKKTKAYIEQEGSKSQIISEEKAGPRVHFANLVTDTQGSRYFFDPRFGMVNPAPLPTSTRKVTQVEVAPNSLSSKTNSCKSSKLTIKYNSTSSITVDLYSRLTSNYISMNYDFTSIKDIPTPIQLSQFFMRSLHITSISPWDSGLYKLNFDMHSQKFYLFRTQGITSNPQGKTYPGSKEFDHLKEYFLSAFTLEFNDILEYLQVASSTLQKIKS